MRSSMFFHQKGVLDELDLIVVDADHVEADAPVESSRASSDKRGRPSRDAAFFCSSMEQTASPKRRRVPLLYLDENEAASFLGDHIYLAQSASVIPFDYLVSPALQGLDCGLFAAYALFPASSPQYSFTPLKVRLWRGDRPNLSMASLCSPVG